VTVVVALLLAIFVLPYPWGIVAVAGSLVVEIVEAWFWIWLSRRRRPYVGAEALVGASAVVVAPCRPAGQVRVAGELWRAVCEAGADTGDLVRIERVEGLTLVVTPAEAAAAR
jgi:membrane protein implicated in regulation of membrane protease activity